MRVWCQRLLWGQGFEVHATTVAVEPSAPLELAVQQINAAVETAILQLPEQYLWGYARYKEPRSL